MVTLGVKAESWFQRELFLPANSEWAVAWSELIFYSEPQAIRRWVGTLP